MNDTITTITPPQTVTTIATTQKALQNKDIQLMAISSLANQLSKVLDFGEAVDVVNRYLWELLDYSIATYIIYNFSEYRFEARTYLKESINPNTLDDVKNSIVKFIQEHQDATSVGELSSLNKGIKPLFFGVKFDEKSNLTLQSSLTVPIIIGDKIVGALNVASTKSDIYSNDTKNLISSFINVASISIARIHTLMQSLNSTTESLIKTLSNGVVMFDTNKQVTLANSAAITFTGLPKEGYYISELSKLFENAKLEEAVDKVLSNAEIVQIPKTKLSRFYYEISVLPVKDFQSRIIGGAVVLHDITHIVEVDIAKTEFVSLASHQLKTPLSAIRWYTEMLQEEKLTDVQKDYVNVIYESNIRMIELVNSLLNVSRIELGNFAVEPVDANIFDIIKGVVTELTPKIATKKLNLIENYDKTIPVMPLDKSLTRIIIQNLLSNAVKYTPVEGKIVLELVKEDTFMVLKVADSGYGIPPHQKAQIFSKLFRADNAKNIEPDGNGLGLYIVKAIVETVGGSISFDSVENKGTIFLVKLPLAGMKSKYGSKALDMASGMEGK